MFQSGKLGTSNSVLRQLFADVDGRLTSMTVRDLHVLTEPDDATKARVDAEEKALRDNLTQSFVYRKERLTEHALLNCSCRTGFVNDYNHYQSYEHVNAAIFYQVYALQGGSMSPSRQRIIDALRPRAQIVGADVLDALDAIVDSREENFMSIAFRFVAQASLVSKGVF